MSLSRLNITRFDQSVGLIVFTLCLIIAALIWRGEQIKSLVQTQRHPGGRIPFGEEPIFGARKDHQPQASGSVHYLANRECAQQG